MALVKRAYWEWTPLTDSVKKNMALYLLRRGNKFSNAKFSDGRKSFVFDDMGNLTIVDHESKISEIVGKKDSPRRFAMWLASIPSSRLNYFTKAYETHRI